MVFPASVRFREEIPRRMAQQCRTETNYHDAVTRKRFFAWTGFVSERGDR